VARPRLIERLNAGLRSGHKLSLVSAPAGFGKTTLVSEWVHMEEALGDEPHQFGWLSLDESDNDPTRFLSYTVAALRTVEPELAQGALTALQSPQPPPAEAVLAAVINELAAIPSPIVLVFDDYHLIHSQPIHDAVSFLLQHLSPHLHLVVATRARTQTCHWPGYASGDN
jgi:LuxR family maltose regulon positive regulatory protein